MTEGVEMQHSPAVQHGLCCWPLAQLAHASVTAPSPTKTINNGQLKVEYWTSSFMFLSWAFHFHGNGFLFHVSVRAALC